jgi:tetratricopeptide (TPR) repeat protein
VKARAKYCIADFYGNKMRGVVEKEYSDKLNMAKSTIESVDALRFNVKMKALFNAFAFKEYQELIDEYPDSYIIPKAILGAFFTAPNAAEKLRIMKAYKDKPFNNDTKKDVYFCLASAYKDTKDFDGAISIWKESINTFSNDRMYCAEALYHIAEYTRGDAQLDAYWEVIKKYPDQETYALMSYDEISGIYGSTGNIDKGVEISLQAIKKYKHHTSIPSRLYAIYSAYQDARKYGKADDIKKRILREYPDSKEAQNFGAD